MNKYKRTRILCYTIGFGLCGGLIALGLYAAQMASAFSQALIGGLPNDSNFIRLASFIGVLVYTSPVLILSMSLIGVAFCNFLASLPDKERAL